MFGKGGLQSLGSGDFDILYFAQTITNETLPNKYHVYRLIPLWMISKK